MDKSLFFWDRWFGTFQQELDAVAAVYGITRPAETWNPQKSIFNISVIDL
jgi:sterol desaturase/sphingolipid hydroxylase (fatty acid hydroxylase superfamily)